MRPPAGHRRAQRQGRDRDRGPGDPRRHIAQLPRDGGGKRRQPRQQQPQRDGRVPHRPQRPPQPFGRHEVRGPAGAPPRLQHQPQHPRPVEADDQADQQRGEVVNRRHALQYAPGVVDVQRQVFTARRLMRVQIAPYAGVVFVPRVAVLRDPCRVALLGHGSRSTATRGTRQPRSVGSNAGLSKRPTHRAPLAYSGREVESRAHCDRGGQTRSTSAMTSRWIVFLESMFQCRKSAASPSSRSRRVRRMSTFCSAAACAGLGADRHAAEERQGVEEAVGFVKVHAPPHVRRQGRGRHRVERHDQVDRHAGAVEHPRDAQHIVGPPTMPHEHQRLARLGGGVAGDQRPAQRRPLLLQIHLRRHARRPQLLGQFPATPSRTRRATPARCKPAPPAAPRPPARPHSSGPAGSTAQPPASGIDSSRPRIRRAGKARMGRGDGG